MQTGEVCGKLIFSLNYKNLTAAKIWFSVKNAYSPQSPQFINYY